MRQISPGTGRSGIGPFRVSGSVRKMATAVCSVGLIVVAAAMTSGCGTTADDRAAVVGDKIVSVQSVNDLTRDKAVVQSIFSGAPAPSASLLSGDLARSASGSR